MFLQEKFLSRRYAPGRACRAVGNLGGVGAGREWCSWGAFRAPGLLVALSALPGIMTGFTDEEAQAQGGYDTHTVST